MGLNYGFRNQPVHCDIQQCGCTTKRHLGGSSGNLLKHKTPWLLHWHKDQCQSLYWQRKQSNTSGPMLRMRKCQLAKMMTLKNKTKWEFQHVPTEGKTNEQIMASLHNQTATTNHQYLLSFHRPKRQLLQSVLLLSTKESLHGDCMTFLKSWAAHAAVLSEEAGGFSQS